MPLPQLRRVRWAVRATLFLGVAASVAANVLHARPDPVSQVIAAWPPLALLLTVELISRVPVHRRSLSAVRLGATTTIAGIAAWVSYWHMAGVAARYGESGASPYLLPLSVDGLIIVASVSLVELAGRIRTAENAPAASLAPQDRTGTLVFPDPTIAGSGLAGSGLAGSGLAGSGLAGSGTAGATTAHSGAAHSRAADYDAADSRSADSRSADSRSADSRSADSRSADSRSADSDSGSPPADASPAGSRSRPGARRTGGSAPARPKRSQPRHSTPARHQNGPRQRRPVADTVALAAQIEAEQPGLTQDELAARLGITTKRLREIRRKVEISDTVKSPIGGSSSTGGQPTRRPDPLRELQPAA